MKDDIPELLQAVRDDFPRLKAHVQKSMAEWELDEPYEFAVGEPEQLDSLPTFHPTVRKELSPMLKARFEFGGDITRGYDIWLSPSKMKAHMELSQVKRMHDSLREHWENSAPMLFPDEQLGLFEVTDGVPESLGYLVWRPDVVEPEIWRYSGMSCQEFSDLAHYLNWCLE